MSYAQTVEPDIKPIPLQACGWGLSWVMAAFGAWAWLLSSGVFTWNVTPASMGYILLAVLSGVVQIASNFAAAAARRARFLEAQLGVTLSGSYAWSLKLMIAGGFYNAFSVHHAWEATGLVPALLPLSLEASVANAPVLALSLALAMFEPALYWIDEALKSEQATLVARAQERAAAKRQTDLLDELNARKGAAAPAPAAAPSAPRNVTKLIRKAANAGAGTAIAVSGASAAAEPIHVPRPPAIDPVAVFGKGYAGMNPRVAEALALRHEKAMTRKEVAAAMGITERQVSRLWSGDTCGRLKSSDQAAPEGPLTVAA